MEALLSKGDRFVDVGANRGLYVQAALLRGASVVAVEPIPWLADDLRTLIRKKGTVLQAAVGTDIGTREIFVPLYDGRLLDTRSSLILDANPGLEHQAISVVVERLDSLAKRADLIKIDVEGAEVDVLQSAHELLVDAATVLIEVEHRHHATNPSAAFELLTNLGYLGYFLDPAADPVRLVPLAQFRFGDHQHQQFEKSPGEARDLRYVNNFLFVHRNRLVPVFDRLNRWEISAIAVETAQ